MDLAVRAAVRGWLFEPDAIVAIVTAREFGEHLIAWIRSSLDRYQKCPLHSKQKRPFLGFWGKFFFLLRLQSDSLYSDRVSSQ